MARGKSSAAAARPKKEERKLPTDASLFDKLEHEEAGKVKSGEVGKRARTWESKISKIIKDNFPNWPSAQVDVLQKDGLTLRQRIAKDKALSAEPGSTLRMGKLYYQDLRELYDDGSDPAKLLPVKNPSEPEDANLRQALIIFIKSRTNTQQLTEWCEMCSCVNQKNLCALFRQILRTYPGQSMQMATLVCDVMKMVVRLGLQAKFKPEVDVMRSHFDLALQKTLANYKCNGFSTALWWQDCSGYARLILPEAAVNDVMSCSSNWGTVEDALATVSSSSEVGRMLCSKALRAHTNDKLEQVVEGLMSEMLKKKRVDEVEVARTRDAFMGYLEDCGGEDWFGMTKKEATVKYRGIPVKLQCATPIDLFSAHLHATLRTQAVALGMLEPLWCEDELVEKGGPVIETLAASLVKPSKVARQVVKDFVSDESGPGLKAALTKKQAFLLQTDRMFKVELQFWFQSIGDQAADRLHLAILKCFPDTSKMQHRSMESTRFSLCVIGHSLGHILCLA